MLSLQCHSWQGCSALCSPVAGVAAVVLGNEAGVVLEYLAPAMVFLQGAMPAPELVHKGVILLVTCTAHALLAGPAGWSPVLWEMAWDLLGHTPHRSRALGWQPVHGSSVGWEASPDCAAWQLNGQLSSAAILCCKTSQDPKD